MRKETSRKGTICFLACQHIGVTDMMTFKILPGISHCGDNKEGEYQNITHCKTTQCIVSVFWHCSIVCWLYCRFDKSPKSFIVTLRILDVLNNISSNRSGQISRSAQMSGKNNLCDTFLVKQTNKYLLNRQFYATFLKNVEWADMSEKQQQAPLLTKHSNIGRNLFSSSSSCSNPRNI